MNTPRITLTPSLFMPFSVTTPTPTIPRAQLLLLLLLLLLFSFQALASSTDAADAMQEQADVWDR
jgi:hypothetical protein